MSTPSRATRGLVAFAAVAIVSASIAGALARDARGDVSPDFPWAGALDTPTNTCVATLIAPRVALTAAHCLPRGAAAPGGTRVAFPALGRAADVRAFLRYRDRAGRPHDGESRRGFFAAGEIDVALAVLARPITLRRYPEIARDPPPHGMLAYGIGRASAARASRRRLPVLAIERWPLLSNHVVVRRGVLGSPARPGDSGGPWIASGTARVIGVSATRILVARIDAIAPWIAAQIERYEDRPSLARVQVADARFDQRAPPRPAR